MDGFYNKDGKVIVESLITVIQKNKAYLSDIDGLIGDGDHGINMNKGFTICEKRLKDKDVGFSESLQMLGRILLMEIGGSMGPLYGTFFTKMAKFSKDEEVIDKNIFANMLEKATDGVADLGNAKMGDKTLVDVLVPALAAFKQSLENGQDFCNCLHNMNAAAKTGWLSTKDLVAKIGRASRLGERSRGVEDAGATSCYLLLESMKVTITSMLVT